MRLLVVLALLLPLLSSAPSKCAVEIAPRVATAPLRYIRVRTTIDDGSRNARVVLVDEAGVITSGEWDVRERTKWIVWQNVSLDAGEYEVVLQTDGGCTARDRIAVGGASN